MLGSMTIRQATLVLPDRVVVGDLVVEDGVIAAIGPSLARTAGEVIDGTGLVVLPGVIDPQVHFREPSDNPAEDLTSGSRAAAAGGVTSFLEMPNTKPTTTTVERLHDKLARAAEKSVVNYGFYIGATSDNLAELNAAERTPGIKIFMGASTGDLLVADPEALEGIFAGANKKIAVHAEDEARLAERRALYADSHDVRDHPQIRDEIAALNATKLAVGFALKHRAHLHILHMTTAEEADYLATVPRDRITAEVCPQHLLLDETAYEQMGTLAQMNPPIRAARHGQTLWKRLIDGTIDCIATDHAPHTLEAKGKPYPGSPSGMPGVEWALPMMLDQRARGRVSWEQIARWMCENPAKAWGIPLKGRLEVGWDADLAIVDPLASRVVTRGQVWTKCGWSPWEGRTVTGWPVITVVGGSPVYRDGAIVDGARGRELTFDRNLTPRA